MLTFDDSSPSQVTLDGTGTPAKNTAVAILQEVAARNPGFPPGGDLLCDADMFGKSSNAEQAQIVAWLGQHGYELGNHTKDHTNLLGSRRRS